MRAILDFADYTKLISADIENRQIVVNVGVVKRLSNI